MPGPSAAELASTGRLLRWQTLLAVFLNAVLIAPLALRLIAFPSRAGVGTFAVGSFKGWLALLLTLAAVAEFRKSWGRVLGPASLCIALLAAGSLVAFNAARFDAVNWFGFHVLL